MRKFSRHTTLTTTLTIAVTLISFGLLTDTSSAERFYQGRAALGKNCNGTGGIFTGENSGAFSCMRPEGGMSINCSASGSCAMVDLNRREGTPSGGPRGDGKGTDNRKGKAIPNGPNRGRAAAETT